MFKISPSVCRYFWVIISYIYLLSAFLVYFITPSYCHLFTPISFPFRVKQFLYVLLSPCCYMRKQRNIQVVKHSTLFPQSCWCLLKQTKPSQAHINTRNGFHSKHDADNELQMDQFKAWCTHSAGPGIPWIRQQLVLHSSKFVLTGCSQFVILNKCHSKWYHLLTSYPLTQHYQQTTLNYKINLKLKKKKEKKVTKLGNTNKNKVATCSVVTYTVSEAAPQSSLNKENASSSVAVPTTSCTPYTFVPTTNCLSVCLSTCTEREIRVAKTNAFWEDKGKMFAFCDTSSPHY
jgi:hypothetical protein